MDEERVSLDEARKQAESLPPVKTPDGTPDHSETLLNEAVRTRRWIGYALGLIGLGVVIWAAERSFATLEGLPVPQDKLTERHHWLGVSGHLVLTVALVFFAYQLLRAAERLILPRWWVERNPEGAKIMLGMSDPADSMKRALEAAADILRPRR